MTLNRRDFLASGAALPLASTLLVPAAQAKSAPAAGQVPGVQRTRVGDAVVTALLDGHTDLPATLLSSFDQEKVAGALADYGHQITDGGIRIPVNGYLVETGGKRILIDAGAADLFAPTLGRLAANLAAAGVTPDQIDMVLLTHLHVDHVGALVDGTGHAYFPNAELVVDKAEWAFWYDDAMMAAAGPQAAGFFEAARTTTTPYQNRLRLFEGAVDLGHGLSSLPLPGHTPGHAGFVLSSGDETLLFWGDVVHMTGLQFAHPELTIAFDMDAAQTRATRARMLDMAASDRMSVTGMHIDFPGFGRVLRAGATYRYQAAPWRYVI